MIMIMMFIASLKEMDMYKILEKNLGLIFIAIAGIYMFASKTGAAVVDAFNPVTGVDDLDISSHTISTIQAASIAEQLYDAMEGMGTNEAAIWDAFRKMKTIGDFNMVYNAFEKRQYSRTWGNAGDMLTSSNYNLIQWLNYELTLAEKARLNRDFPFIRL